MVGVVRVGVSGGVLVGGAGAGVGVGVNGGKGAC